MISGVQTGIAVDATSIYFAKGTSLRRCPIGACAGNDVELGTLPASGSEVTGITVDAARIYVVQLNNGPVSSCPLAGCNGAPTNLGHPSYRNEGGLAVDARSVFFEDYDADQIEQCPLAGWQRRARARRPGRLSEAAQAGDRRAVPLLGRELAERTGIRTEAREVSARTAAHIGNAAPI